MALIDFLRSCYLFRDLDDTDLRWLSDVAKSRVLNPGEMVFREGDSADCLVLIKAGTAEIQKESASGSQHLATLGPASIIGEIAYVERDPRSASAHALERLEVLELGYADLDARMTKDPSFGGRLYHSIARALIKTIRRTTNDLTALRELTLRGRD